MSTELQATMMTSAAAAAPPLPAELLAKARMVTGENIKGTVRIMPLSELQRALAAATMTPEQQKAVADKARNEEKSKAEAAEAKLRAELNQALARVAELESQLKQAGQDKQAAAEQARAEGLKRIRELEFILKSDDARAKVAFLEQEVARLSALVDRYEAGLEFITAVEIPEVGPDVALAAELKARVPAALHARLDQIAQGIQGAHRALTQGVDTIRQRKGSIYGCADLIERAANLSHWHNELLSIKAAVGG